MPNANLRHYTVWKNLMVAWSYRLFFPYLLTILQDLQLVRHAALLVGRGDPSTLLSHVLSKVYLARFAQGSDLRSGKIRSLKARVSLQAENTFGSVNNFIKVFRFSGSRLSHLTTGQTSYFSTNGYDGYKLSYCFFLLIFTIIKLPVRDDSMHALLHFHNKDLKYCP